MVFSFCFDVKKMKNAKIIITIVIGTFLLVGTVSAYGYDDDYWPEFWSSIFKQKFVAVSNTDQYCDAYGVNQVGDCYEGHPVDYMCEDCHVAGFTVKCYFTTDETIPCESQPDCDCDYGGTSSSCISSNTCKSSKPICIQVSGDDWCGTEQDLKDICQSTPPLDGTSMTCECDFDYNEVSWKRQRCPADYPKCIARNTGYDYCVAEDFSCSDLDPLPCHVRPDCVVGWGGCIDKAGAECSDINADYYNSQYPAGAFCSDLNCDYDSVNDVCVNVNNNGIKCDYNQQCIGGNYDDDNCTGECSDWCTKNNEWCARDGACCSGVCNNNVCYGQGICGTLGDSCSIDSDCCPGVEGLVCISGKCDFGYGGETKTCSQKGGINCPDGFCWASNDICKSEDFIPKVNSREGDDCCIGGQCLIPSGNNNCGGSTTAKTITWTDYYSIEDKKLLSSMCKTNSDCKQKEGYTVACLKDDDFNDRIELGYEQFCKDNIDNILTGLNLLKILTSLANIFVFDNCKFQANLINSNGIGVCMAEPDSKFEQLWDGILKTVGNFGLPERYVMVTTIVLLLVIAMFLLNFIRR